MEVKSILLDYNIKYKQYLLGLTDKEDNIVQYVVCKNYKPEERYGEQWDFGHYFVPELGYGLKDAVEYLYRTEN